MKYWISVFILHSLVPLSSLACEKSVVRCSDLRSGDKREYFVQKSYTQLAAYLLDAKKYVVIDTRPSEKYLNCHVKGALNFEFPPVGSGGASGGDKNIPLLNRKVVQNFMGSGKKIVFLCSTCHRSGNAAAYALCKWGVPEDRVIWIAEGVEDLKKIKYSGLVGEGCQGG